MDEIAQAVSCPSSKAANTEAGAGFHPWVGGPVGLSLSEPEAAPRSVTIGDALDEMVFAMVVRSPPTRAAPGGAFALEHQTYPCAQHSAPQPLRVAARNCDLRACAKRRRVPLTSEQPET